MLGGTLGGTLGGAILPLLFALGCTPARLVDALTPASGYTAEKDLAYGPDLRQRLDLYLPADAKAAGAAPVVIFFYGGSWQSGDKATYRFVGQALAARGYVVAIPDYRVYPQVRYPEFLRDGAEATRFVYDRVGACDGDPSRVVLAGHSAGAYIAAMLALDPRWLGRDRHRIAGLIGLAGPYDFLPIRDPVLQTIFSTEGDLALTQPIRYADASAPPAFLAAGSADEIVDPGNTKRLAARLRAAGVNVTERAYRGVGHVLLIGAISVPFRFIAPVLRDLTDFLRSVGRQNSGMAKIGLCTPPAVAGLAS